MEDAAVLESAYRDGKSLWSEQPRATLKTTTRVAFISWMVGRDPQISILYVTNRDKEAKDRNLWIQGVMHTADYRRVFGQKAALLQRACNASKTTVRGKTMRSKANVEVTGVGSVRAGEHYDCAYVDDVCDTTTSHLQPARKAGIKKVYDEQIDAQVNPSHTGRGRLGVGLVFGCGTTYAADDLNADLSDEAKHGHEQNGAWRFHRTAVTLDIPDDPDEYPQKDTQTGTIWRIARRHDPERHRPFESYETPLPEYGGQTPKELITSGRWETLPADIITPYPTVLPLDYLYAKYAGGRRERSFRLNYCLEPVGEDEKPFHRLFYSLPEKWIANGKEMGKWSEQVAAFGYEPPALPPPEDMTAWYRLMAVDPGFSEKKDSSCTGVCIGALAPDGNIFILYATKFKHRWEKTLDKICDLHGRYGCNALVFEIAGQQEAAFNSLEKELRQVRGIQGIDRISPANQSKVARAKLISDQVNNGYVYLPGRVDPTRRGQWRLMASPRAKDLPADLLAFPATEEEDLVDAFVYCITRLRERSASMPRQDKSAGSIEAAVNRRRMKALDAIRFGAKEKKPLRRADVAVFAHLN